MLILETSKFFTSIGDKPLQSVTLNNLQTFAKALIKQGYSPATQKRRINTIKSLLGYGYALGVLSVNVGKLLKPPRVKNTLAERILSETQIHSMMALTTIVREAAKRGGIEGAVSPHWLRHAHASHAIERGTPIALVQATLGYTSTTTTGLYLHVRPKASSALYLSV
jgi:site-specific recombinase XerD